ncbi:MAG: RelA/SpoT family protein [Pseudomonadota bacterium]|nr:RelA/SpoT family protein [Pseudomonadota bacterium]
MQQMQWLEDANYLRPTELELINKALVLVNNTSFEVKNPVFSDLHEQYVFMLEALATIRPDVSIITAAIVYPYVNYADLTLDTIRSELGDEIAKIVAGVIKMSAIGNFAKYKSSNDDYEQLRRMLLAMIADVRIIIIKIAEQVSFFRQARADEDLCKQLALETQAIYAPLANRLGVSELKWQLEDFAFRYLQQEEYKKIASGLAAKRKQREIYAEEFMVQLRSMLEEVGVNAISIKSRVKHIYSIYMKMKRKNKSLAEIYDQIAVRVIVPDVAKCYSTLSTIHAIFNSISGEFDDYVASPKGNGYQSIHTAVYGPEEKVVEIQIRTQHMHEFAECGVAAHWLYKEGGANKNAKSQAAWLTNLLAWQSDVNQDANPEKKIFGDEVFAFTPQGDVKALANGATVLDFAYAIHTQIGHRCRGAKVNDKMVQLTTKLKNGDIVTILTHKNGTPSRDWLEPRNNYLFTSRARSKVQSWFRSNDFARHVHEGHIIIERELKKDALFKQIGLQKLILESPYASGEQLCAAVARGEYTVQALSKILQQFKQDNIKQDPATFEQKVPTVQKKNAEVLAGNTLSKISLCCKPAPGDNIIGYVTKGKGISIHRRDCPNITNLSPEGMRRLIEVSWAENFNDNYPVDLLITANESSASVREVNNCLSSQKATLLNLNCFRVGNEVGLKIKITIEVQNSSSIEQLVQKLNALPEVFLVEKLR